MTMPEYMTALLDPRSSQGPDVREVAETMATLTPGPDQIAYLTRVQSQNSPTARVSEVAFELLQWLTGDPEWAAA